MGIPSTMREAAQTDGRVIANVTIISNSHGPERGPERDPHEAQNGDSVASELGAGADYGHDDSIPTHPLGVKPLGNQYLSNGPNARSSIGTFGRIPDEVLMLLLEHFDGPTLRQLGSSCKFMHAFCHADELWRTLFTSASRQKPVKWRGSWRATALDQEENHKALVDCGNVFSDVLHRPYACSQLNLSLYTSNIPKKNLIRQFTNLSYEEFAGGWTEKPFILTESVRKWPACMEWSINTLAKKYADVEFRAESVDWPFATYRDYMARNSDESPLYLFDRKFVEKMGITVGQDSESAYWKPETFGPDLFEVLGKERPAHRWLIVGSRGSGSTFHKDPNATSAWNTVVEGSKYWIMFPPDASVPGVYVSADNSEVTSPLSIAEWLLTFHEEARQLPDCIEGICGPGEILHVPSGWWHLVVNLEPGIAITQNFVPKSPSLHHLAEALGFLRDRPEQVTGFSREVENPYGLFAERLREQFPELLDGALEVLERRKRPKRKWDVAVGDDDDKEEGRAGGFSFGFGADDEDEID